MRYVGYILIALALIIVAGFLHYTLPQNDIVRIVNAEVRRVDFGNSSIFWASPDAGTSAAGNRDVRFIETIEPDGDPMVYRNEDTGWGWPPYFKFDSANLQARAQDLSSTRDDPQWVAVRHYGWRSELFSIFPNAVAITPVAGPEVSIFPWRAVIAILVGLALILAAAVAVRLVLMTIVEPAIERVRGWGRR